MGDLDVGARRARLSESKRRLLEARLRGEGTNPRRAAVLDEGPLDLSPAQRRLWFLGQLDPDSTAYAMVKAVRLTGPLNVSALDATLKDLTERHGTLRMEIGSRGGKPEAILRPPSKRVLTSVDISGVEHSAQECTVRALVAQIAGRPFALDKGDVMRATLLRLGPDRHVLSLVLHHIVADGWSIGILFRDLCRCYNARLGGPPAPPPPQPYHLVARAQSEALTEDRRRVHIDYWRRRLGDAPRAVTLPPPPTPRPLAKLAGRVMRDLPRALVNDLDRLCRARGITIFMALLATAAAVISRFTGQSDVVIGTPVSGRDDPDAAEVVGLFINMLPLRMVFAQSTPFEELLEQARQVTVGALAHQDLPFEDLVRALNVPRQPGRSPIFQTLFVHQVAPRFEETMKGLRMAGLDVAPSRPVYELTISSVERPEGLRLVAEFDSSKLSAETAQAILGALETALGTWMEALDRRVGMLPMEAVRDPALEGHPAVTSETPIHSLVEANAARAPDRIAVEDDAGQASYACLSRRARRIAAGLLRSGLGPGALVGLALPRNVDLVATILALEMCGAAFFPLQPGQPAGRVEALFAGRAPDLVLVGPADLVDIPRGWRRVALPDLETELAGGLDPVPFEAAETAYVMPTSGSTGTPKAVACTRGALLAHLDAMAVLLPLTPNDVILAGTSLNFDISLLELLLPLRLGARLSLTGGGSDPVGDMARRGSRAAATVIQATPTGWRSLIDINGIGAACRIALVGGETMPRRLADDLQLRGLEVWNLYGPTEATIWCAATLVADNAGAPPIGGPIQGVRLAILDETRRLVPVGVEGELYIAGAGLALGYIGAPGSTAASFVPDPSPDRPGDRIYRTGDWARRRGDGLLDFLGRRDRQTKIRGYRVDLHEVEEALSTLPGVEETAAVAVEDRRTGSRRLIAYVRLAKGVAVDRAAWRRYLAPRLVPTMIPTVFVPVAAMPRTANGKLDRAALPAPTPHLLAADAAGPAIADARERRFCGLVGRVLDIPAVGLLDNFFDLGGDSMRAVELVALAAGDGFSIRLRDIFERQTIRGLLDGAKDAGKEPPPAPGPFEMISARDRRRLPNDVEAAFPLSRMQSGIAVDSVRHPGLYQAVLNLELALDLDPEDVRDRLTRLIARDPALRTRFALTGFEEPLQLVQRHAAAIVEAVDLGNLLPAEQQRRRDETMKADCARPVPLDEAPMLRCRLTRLAAGRVELTLVFHHAMFDGWSRALLMTALIRGVPMNAAPDPALARRFVAEERAIVRDPDVCRAWTDALQAAPPPALPARPSPRLTRQVELPLELVEGLRRCATALGVPLKTLVLGAHLTALGRLLGARRVVSGVIVNARPAVKGAETGLGLFVNTLPVCVDVTQPMPRLVEAVHAAEAELMDRRVFPLAEIQRLTGRRDLAHVVFNMTDFVPYRALASEERPIVLDARSHEVTGIGFAANFGVDPFSGKLQLTLEAAHPDRDAHWLGRAAGVYAATLRDMTGDVGGQVAAIPPLTPPPPAEPLSGVLPTAAAILAQADLAAHHIAVVADDGCMSYGALADHARALMDRLRAAGCGPGGVVGVSTSRTVALPVALVAVLGVGAAYAPLDPEDPEDRLRGRLQEMGVRVVLAPGSEAARFAAFGLRMIVIDAPHPVVRTAPDEVDPELPAYVIHTSGSTGRPKGVVVSRLAMDLYVASATGRFALTPADVVLQFASLTFDAAVEEIFPTLRAGATLVLRSGEAALSAKAFLAYCAVRQISVLNLPTAFWRVLTEALSKTGAIKTSAKLPANVRLAVIGGEAATVDTLSKWRDRTLATVALENTYGPTEATVVATAERLGAPKTEWPGRSVPIGRPVAGVQALLVDKRGAPVPTGEIGELLLSGPRLAQGYLHRPAETADCFLPAPWSKRPGARSYRTGDLAIADPEGRLFFAGRADRQIKLRGYRIELDEVEAAICADPEVAAAAVEAIAVPGPDLSIVAAIVPSEPDQWPARLDALRTRLGRRLPEYMAPTRILTVASLPQTASGKVDRRALREALGSAPPPALVTPPRTRTERVLAEIWCSLLGLEAVDRDADFFAVGGHSLLALQLLTRIEEAWGVAPPVAAVFEASRLCELAARVDHQLGAEDSHSRPAITRAPAGRTAPLSLEQSDLWRQNRLAQRFGFFNMPIAARVAGTLDVHVLSAALRGVVDRHQILRTVFPAGAGEGEQMTAPLDAFDLDVIDLIDARPEVIRTFIGDEARLPFDLEHELPFRATLLTLGPEAHVLSMTLHHIVGDAWSLRLLFSELSASLADPPKEVAPPSLQYRDYAIWQRRMLEEGGFAPETAYWRRRLARLDAAPPMLRVRGPRRKGLFESRRATISGDRARRLRTFAGSFSSTPFMVVLSAFAVLDRLWSGSVDFRVATMIANRNEKATEAIIGLFANTLILRSDTSAAKSFEDVLGTMRGTLVEAFANRAVPFEAVTDQLWAGDPPPIGAIRAMVLMNADSDATLDLGPNRVEAADVAMAADVTPRPLFSTFDLILNIVERAESFELELRYCVDTLEPAEAERFLGALVAVLDTATTAPGISLSGLRAAVDRQ